MSSGIKKPYYGACLVTGKHRPGSAEARECPLTNAAARSERSRKAAAARWRGQADPVEHGEGSTVTPAVTDAPEGLLAQEGAA